MKKITNLVLFLADVGIALFAPVYSIMTFHVWILAFLAILISAYFYFFNFELFVPTLFFSIVAVLNPLLFRWIITYDINIPQINFLIPILIYLAIIFNSTACKKEINWWSVGQFDRITIFLLITMIVVSSSSLIAWTCFVKKDLGDYLKFIPDISLGLLVLYGLFFPLFNSIFEEFLARAVLLDGLHKACGAVIPAILSQALIFALWHYRGFPGGILGVIMVFIWSIFLGIIRVRSKGMLAPLITHFFADLSIAMIILFIHVIPGRV